MTVTDPSSRWDLVNPRRYFSERREPSTSADVHLTPSQHYGVLPQEQYIAVSGSKPVLNLSGQDSMRHVERGDFIAHLRSFQGGLETSSYRGKVSSAYTVISPGPLTLSGYFRWVFKSSLFISQLAGASQQLRDGQSVKFEDVTRIQLPLPPLDEQRRIADFLDDRVDRIDRIIAARRQQMQLVIAAHRPSVVLGEAMGCGEWTEGQLRRFMRSHDGVRIPLSTEERATRGGAFPYYGASGVIDSVDDYLFDQPRLLVSEDGANLLLRSSPIAFVAEGQYWVNNHAHVLEPHDRAHAFWAARVEMLDVSPWVTGSAQPKLTADALMALPVSAPVSESRRHDLGRELKHVDAEGASKRVQLLRSIDLLTEYKSSLITAAVTGELDVTTASRRIPGE